MKAINRRRFLKTTAIAGAAIAAPYIRTTHSAGSLSLGIWDHWVPGANDVMKKLVQVWGRKERVGIQIDFITSIGQKDRRTAAAESRARSGHDIISLPTWETTIHKDSLEPVDDVYRELLSQNGRLTPDVEFVFKHEGVWRSLPAPAGGNHSYPMVSRLDYFKRLAGVDLQSIFPASPKRNENAVSSWNYNNFLIVARKLHAAGHPFGNPISSSSDSQDWLCPLFRSFGAIPVNERGEISIDSDETRAALEYLKQLSHVMPPEVYVWDDSGNNRWLISGKGSGIQNPPSAWSVAKRDQPQVAAQLWHHDTPSGPHGRFRGTLPRGNGIWKFSKNKSAAKALLSHLLSRESQFQLVSASQGYDMPVFPSMFDHPIWSQIDPPLGGQYNYPFRGDEEAMVGGSPAPAPIAAKIYHQALISTLVARVTQGNEPIDNAIRWAIPKLENICEAHLKACPSP